MSEILGGIKLLKLYAWEPSFLQQVEGIRRDELRLLRRATYLYAISIFIWICTPFLVRPPLRGCPPAWPAQASGPSRLHPDTYLHCYPGDSHHPQCVRVPGPEQRAGRREGLCVCVPVQYLKEPPQHAAPCDQQPDPGNPGGHRTFCWSEGRFLGSLRVRDNQGELLESPSGIMENYAKLNEVMRISGHLGSEKVRWGPWKPEFWRQTLLTNLDPVFGSGSQGRLSHGRGPRTCVWAFRGLCLTQEVGGQASLEGVG